MDIPANVPNARNGSPRIYTINKCLKVNKGQKMLQELIDTTIRMVITLAKPNAKKECMAKILHIKIMWNAQNVGINIKMLL